MAQSEFELDKISCSICLDLLKDPVTIPCGHSYCMNCIKDHWDGEDQKRTYSCPQCRKEFMPRPVLGKNIILAELVEDLKKIGLQAAPADHCYAGPEDVACDVCTGRKIKAVKSCLVCMASYCENHLQPHHESSILKKHKIVEASAKLQQNFCSRHGEVMKIFCRTDQQCICYLCSMDEHKYHETVPAAAERTEKQKKLQESRQQIHQRIQDQEKDVKLLQQEVDTINVSADKAVEDSEEIFTELIRLLQKRSSEVKQQIRYQQETEVSRVKDVQEKLEQEISDLKRKDAELEQLLHTEDHNQFLLNYPSLPALREFTHSYIINIHPVVYFIYFEDVRQALTELKFELCDVLIKRLPYISEAIIHVDDLLSEQERSLLPESYSMTTSCTPDHWTPSIRSTDYLLLSTFSSSKDPSSSTLSSTFSSTKYPFRPTFSSTFRPTPSTTFTSTKDPSSSMLSSTFSSTKDPFRPTLSSTYRPTLSSTFSSTKDPSSSTLSSTLSSTKDPFRPTLSSTFRPTLSSTFSSTKDPFSSTLSSTFSSTKDPFSSTLSSTFSSTKDPFSSTLSSTFSSTIDPSSSTLSSTLSSTKDPFSSTLSSTLSSTKDPFRPTLSSTLRPTLSSTFSSTKDPSSSTLSSTFSSTTKRFY